MLTRLPLLMLTIVAFSCKNIQKENRSSLISTDTVAKVQIADAARGDTSAYKPLAYHYTFDTALDFRKNILDGWMDTFSIKKRLFRLRVDSLEQENEILSVEYYKNGAWMLNVELGYYAQWDFGFDDMNKDGFTDFYAGHKRGADVNFFNPQANLFDTTTQGFLGGSVVLDSTAPVYYTYWSDDGYPLISSMYAFKAIKPFYYYSLFYKERSGGGTSQFVGLWKCKNGIGDIDSAYLIKKIILADNEHGEDFDYEKFWKKNYKRLIKEYTPGEPKHYYRNYKPFDR